jgi:hypothetical protein
VEVPDALLRNATLSISTRKVRLRSNPRLIFVKIPVREIVLPVVGMGFLFFHFFDSESKKQ